MRARVCAAAVTRGLLFWPGVSICTSQAIISYVTTRDTIDPIQLDALTTWASCVASSPSSVRSGLHASISWLAAGTHTRMERHHIHTVYRGQVAPTPTHLRATTTRPHGLICFSRGSCTTFAPACVRYDMMMRMYVDIGAAGLELRAPRRTTIP
jgi:hypothetical protein